MGRGESLCIARKFVFNVREMFSVKFYSHDGVMLVHLFSGLWLTLYDNDVLSNNSSYSVWHCIELCNVMLSLDEKSFVFKSWNVVRNHE